MTKPGRTVKKPVVPEAPKPVEPARVPKLKSLSLNTEGARSVALRCLRLGAEAPETAGLTETDVAEARRLISRLELRA